MKNKFLYLALPLMSISLCESIAAELFSKAEICKGAISSEFYREVKTMKTLSASSENPEITYKRDDGNIYRYQCKFSSNQIIWRTFFNDKVKKGWGRWRDTDPNDSKITYEINNNILFIKNSSTDEIYKFNKKDY